MLDRVTTKTNDAMQLTLRTEMPGPVLEFDFPSVKIGIAEYDEGPTGCTVFSFPAGTTSAIDVRGGLPGTVMGSVVEDGPTTAICFAGGSLLGFEAITGVTAELFACGDKGPARVRGAIIWDFGVRDNMVYPDKALGQAAMQSARSGIFPLGPHGAGRSATVGKWLLPPYVSESSGQGGAFWQNLPTKIAVFTVVNAVGGIMDRTGAVVRGHLNTETGVRARIGDVIDLTPGLQATVRPAGANTTLTVVLTNQRFDLEGLRHLARQIHSSMARAIYPFHTISDGDILFAVSTNEIADDRYNPYVFAHVASELAWDAVLNCYEKP